MSETDQNKVENVRKKAVNTPEFSIKDAEWSMHTIRGYRASDSDSDSN